LRVVEYWQTAEFERQLKIAMRYEDEGSLRVAEFEGCWQVV